MNGDFTMELAESGYIHKPLPLHEERSLEQKLKNKSVLGRKILWESGAGYSFCSVEQGKAEMVCNEDQKWITMEAPLVCDCWPEGMPQNGDCSYYGHIRVPFLIGGEDWREYNRIRISLYPFCEGLRTVSLSVYLINDGCEKIPDRYHREGLHMMNVTNREWNDCIWEFSSLPRDRVMEFGFRYRLAGKDISCGEKASFRIKSVVLERVKHPEKEEGWLPEEGTFAYATSGYEPDGKKQAVVNTKEKFFRIEDRNGHMVMDGEIGTVVWRDMTFKTIDFTEIKKEGSYRLCVGDKVSPWFPIEKNRIEEVLWKGLNFLFCERCGYPVPGKHGMCHMDIYAEHNGLKLPFCGGWHDAGDMSQQMTQSAETVESLLEAAAKVKGNPLLYQRMMEEALWGLEFLLRTRFGDGYRATSLGLIRWTDGKIGNEDDAGNVRVHNHSLDNFICAGIEALASVSLEEYDKELAWKCKETAKKDFEYAWTRWQEYDMELPAMWEHTYSSGRTLYYSEIILASSRIFEITGEERYGKIAVEYAGKLLRCQEKDETIAGLRGFFYRDETCREIVHYNHQSREHVPVMALRTLCQIQKQHPDKTDWERGIYLYGEYLKGLMKYASPYRMLPAGIYAEREADNRETFGLLHLQADYDREKENYVDQVKNGISAGKGFYVRQFPVWFSFRGNTAVMLSMAKGAGIAGAYLRDEALLQIASDQIDWFLGKNPFTRSLMYGVGEGYEQMFSTFTGTSVGQLPVGIQTRKNEDSPYWPQGNNSTYKEVWVSSLTKLYGVVAEIYKNQK